MVHFVAIDRLEEHASLDEVFDPNISIRAASADRYEAGRVIRGGHTGHHHNA
jgi:hypothetical protein